MMDRMLRLKLIELKQLAGILNSCDAFDQLIAGEGWEPPVSKGAQHERGLPV